MQVDLAEKAVAARSFALLLPVALACLPVAVAAQQRPVAPAPAVVEAQLPPNSEVFLALTSELSSATAREGQSFALTVDSDVMLENAVAIPKGATAIGHVTKVKSAGVLDTPGTIAVMIDTVQVRGKTYRLAGQLTYQPPVNLHHRNVTAVLGGAVGLALLPGHAAVLPAGRQFVVVTSEAIPVTVTRPARDDTPDLFKVDPEQLSRHDRRL